MLTYSKYLELNLYQSDGFQCLINEKYKRVKKMRRLGLYLIYDKEGIIDRYIPYLLHSIRSQLSYLIVILNGDPAKEECRKLDGIADEIFIRDNAGYDAGGFKDVFVKYLERDRLFSFDEVILFNDSFFGPFFDFSAVFEKMSEKETDFWSLTKDNGSVDRPAAIQSYFLVIRKNLLHSDTFQKYWEELPYFDDFYDVVTEYEAKFAKYFEDRGYKWDSYICMDKYDCECDRKYSFSSYHNVQYELMREQKYPVLKRKLFALESDKGDYGLNRKTQENFLQALKYIKTSTSYDMSMIWENILRTYNLRDIQDNCCFHYVLNERADEHPRYRLLTFVWLDSSDFEYIDRVKIISEISAFIIFASSAGEARKLKEIFCGYNCNVVIEKKGLKEIFKYKDEIRRYDFFCVIPYYDLTPDEMTPYTVEASKKWGDWTNTIENIGYVNAVIHLFESQKNIGLAVVPQAIHAHYFRRIGTGWENEYPQVHQLAEKLKIEKYIALEKEPADWSCAFWCRSVLFDSDADDTVFCEYEDEIIAMILPYFAQSRGFYTGIIESMTYSGMHLSLQNICLRGLIQSYSETSMFRSYTDLRYEREINQKNKKALDEFIKEHKDIYIYGAGVIAKKVAANMEHYKGFIVTDGQKKQDELFGKPVMFLSETSIKGEDGIIVAMDRKHKKEVMPALIEKGLFKQLLQIEG